MVVSGDLTDFGFEDIGSPCGVSQRKKKKSSRVSVQLEERRVGEESSGGLRG